MTEEINTTELGEAIVQKLKTIYDTEIPVDIYELGLIYDVMVNTDYEVKILMTLTSPNCPVAESLPREVEEKVKSIEHVKDADKVLEESYRVLKKGGVLVMTAVNPVFDRLATIIGFKPNDHLRTFNLSQLKKLSLTKNFMVREAKRFGPVFYELIVVEK